MNYGLRIIFFIVLILNSSTLFAQEKVRLIYKFNDGNRNVFCFFSDSTFQYADFSGCTDQIIGNGRWGLRDSLLTLHYEKAQCPINSIEHSSHSSSDFQTVIFEDAYGRLGKWLNIDFFTLDSANFRIVQTYVESTYNLGMTQFEKADHDNFEFRFSDYLDDKSSCDSLFARKLSSSDTVVVKLNYCWQVLSKLNTRTHLSRGGIQEVYKKKGNVFYEENGNGRLYRYKQRRRF